MKENQCYVCKRTENEIKDMLIHKMDELSKEYDKRIKSSFDNEIILRGLIEKRDFHLKNREHQLENIKKLTHRKIFRKIISADGFLPKIATSVASEDPTQWPDEHLPKSAVESPFSIDVCAICYSLVKHMADGNLDKNHFEELFLYEKLDGFGPAYG